jgi:hypothetical protein
MERAVLLDVEADCMMVYQLAVQGCWSMLNECCFMCWQIISHGASSLCSMASAEQYRAFARSDVEDKAGCTTDCKNSLGLP